MKGLYVHQYLKRKKLAGYDTEALGLLVQNTHTSLQDAQLQKEYDSPVDKDEVDNLEDAHEVMQKLIDGVSDFESGRVFNISDPPTLGKHGHAHVGVGSEQADSSSPEDSSDKQDEPKLKQVKKKRKRCRKG